MILSIRAGQVSDARALAKLHHESRKAAMPWLAEVHTEDETLDYLAHVVLVHDSVWVAEQDGQLVGYLAVDLNTGELHHLYLGPQMQRQGLGSTLLEKAKALSPAGLFLWFFQRNLGARSFYEKHGFQLEYATDGTANEENEPDARYRWRPFL